MVKYYNAMVVFEEVPDEITIAINITNCPCNCRGCHSNFLWEDVGTELSFKELDDLLKKNEGVTCVCFMGGDREPNYINELAFFVKENHKGIKTAWYSGRDEMSRAISLDNFDFIKIGHYDEKFGGLDKRTTNQRMYQVIKKGENEHELSDITKKFWKFNK